MIRLVEPFKHKDIYKIRGNKADNVDLQDLVYRLQQDGFVTDFGSNMKISNPEMIEYTYVFTDPLTAFSFKRSYQKHRKKIMDEKKWRQNI